MRAIATNILVLAAAGGLVAASCTSDTDGDTDGDTSSSTTSSSSSGVGGAGGAGVGGASVGGAGGAVPAACLPDGIYGKCSENNSCFCLQGATVYQFCTITCADAAECAADTPGATTGCYPINPGANENICALLCTTTADCPCGLTCMPSGLQGIDLCAEFQ
jgi:hypothetical protein